MCFVHSVRYGISSRNSSNSPPHFSTSIYVSRRIARWDFVNRNLHAFTCLQFKNKCSLRFCKFVFRPVNSDLWQLNLLLYHTLWFKNTEKRNRKREREKERKRERENVKKREREKERKREREKKKKRERQKDRKREREKEIKREKEKERNVHQGSPTTPKRVSF